MELWKKQFIRHLFPYSPSRMNIELAFMLKHPHVPSHLYKYRSFCENHLGALEKNVLWMSAPQRFNDPFDGAVRFFPDRFLVEDMPAEEFIRQVKETANAVTSGGRWEPPTKLTNPIRSGDWRRKICTQLMKDIPLEGSGRAALLNTMEDFMRQQNEVQVQRMTDTFRQGFSALSLSENSSSTLMWSHYSDSHRGFCIEYDFSTLPYGDLRRRLCCPVFYTAKLRDATRYLSSGTRSFNNLFGQLMLLMKLSDWAYEKEWRIIDAIGPAHANKELAMPAPSAIILGSQVESGNEKLMLDNCKRKNIPLRKMVVNVGGSALDNILVWKP